MEKLAIGDRAHAISIIANQRGRKQADRRLYRKAASACRGTARNVRSLKRILAKMDEATMHKMS